MKKTLTLLVSLLFLCIVLNGKTTYHNCIVYKVSSANGNYYLWSYPYDNIIESIDGRTVVYRSDSTFMYEIPRYFENLDEQKLFLSNDGKTILYSIDREYRWDNLEYKCLELYKKGHKSSEYSIVELLGCNDDYEYCYLFYKDAIKDRNWKNGKYDLVFKDSSTDFEKTISQIPAYHYNDTVLIFTSKNILLKVDLQSGNVYKIDFKDIDETAYNFALMDAPNIERIKYEDPYFSYLDKVKLLNDKSFNEGLAEYMDMDVFWHVPEHLDKYKKHRATLEIFINSSGEAYLKSIKYPDRYGCNNLTRDKVEGFLSQTKFDVSCMPKEIDKWLFSGTPWLKNKDEQEAIKEREEEKVEEEKARQKRLVADSIDGVYIPRNLEECFIELNKILKPRDIEQIKSDDGTALYHMSLGMWIRNNWGLWGGSRLQQYLEERGEWHADSMSGVILSYYQDWLNGRHEKWKKYDTNRNKKKSKR